jgi:hypothetical protein
MVRNTDGTIMAEDVRDIEGIGFGVRFNENSE